MEIEKRLKEIGLELPAAPAPVGNYLPYRVTGSLVYLSGSICMKDGVMVYPGPVGGTCTESVGYEAARFCAITQLAILKSVVGDLDRVRQLVNLAGFVWGVEGFVNAPKVINGASDFFVEVFGDKGRHSRTAVSVSGLPAGSAVEIQTVWELS
jgi:enamine deaminase RidA (YjgF/YER057c/UK114 family)